MMSRHSEKNRAFWNTTSDDYQAKHGEQLRRSPLAWGTFSTPEADLNLLGDVRNKDILELGCGGAQWSIALAQSGARVVALDNSERQLWHAERAMEEAGITFRLVHADAEAIPFPNESFDIVFAD